jgi:glycyl-tRNA synthetase beta chain
MARDVLVELGVEELPSGMVFSLGEALAARMKQGLLDARITHGDVHAYSSPRRLAVVMHDVNETQPNQTISRLGPREDAGRQDDGTPTQALLGFARSCDVSVDMLSVIETPKGCRFAYEANVPGVSTLALLPEIITHAVLGLPIAKPMRWGDGDASFVRPMHWLVVLFGDEVVPMELLGVKASNTSTGHRYHHPEHVLVSSPRAYEVCLEEAGVMADFSVRRDAVRASVQAAVNELDADVVMPDALLDEVTSIVEWPSALRVDFDEAFLQVPSEVLIASMQQHQKCFAVRDRDGALLPHFVTVSNIKSTSPARVVKGNQRVMKARLSDAAFFYAEDKKQTLEARVDATEHVVFQAKLGSLRDKTRRLETLVGHIATLLHYDRAEAMRAARLSKCDLLTGMVGEFPELQGVMGRYYARLDGESDAVSCALHEQYLPRFSSDTLPETILGLILSLADRLDTLVGAFGLGMKPKGDRDPFKLRRHALAVVRLFKALPLSLGLQDLLQAAISAYGVQFEADKTLASTIKGFILDRLPAYYHDVPHAIELVRAASANQSDCMRDLDARIQALRVFLDAPEARALAAVCKRVNKLLEHAALTSDDMKHDVDEALFSEEAERALFDHVRRVEVIALEDAGTYDTILQALASLREPLDVFFEHVMVMADDTAVKLNRLRLLKRLQALLQGVADMSLLP